MPRSGEHFAHGGPGLAEMVLVETTGSETQVFVKFGGERITAVFHGRSAKAPETMVAPTSDVAAIHPFDGKTGSCLAEPGSLNAFSITAARSRAGAEGGRTE
jgi:hypothetical protein